eukprot:CAMPEP_0174888426 /NCGR_PEP_ID=MMETSP0167-20121228/3717_1 /TAXON_ID=38298 /ORGANISM="Rhodella maculata, Strain CCMP736" /LENGTH=47 /DNA_ID= /DNA_START= /DNA_END= /DNA_ORIENTATION=
MTPDHLNASDEAVAEGTLRALSQGRAQLEEAGGHADQESTRVSVNSK